MKNLILIALLFVSCTQAPLTEKEARKILEERNEKLAQLFKAGDAEKLSLIYTENAKLCPNGSDFHLGRKAIADFWGLDMKSSKLVEMTTETITVDVTGDVIYETGRTRGKSMVGDSVIEFKVKFANVWRKQANGEYLLDVDIWNALSEE